VDSILLLGLGLATLILALPIIALVRALLAARLAKRNDENWQKLTQRVYALEGQLRELESRLKAQAVVLDEAFRKLPAAAIERQSPVPAEPVPAKPAEPPVAVAGPEGAPIEPPRGASVLAPPEPALAGSPAAGITTPPAPPVSVAPPVPLPIEAPRASTTPPSAPLPPPQFEMLGDHPASSSADAARRALNMEEVLGTDWLNKLGMIILVIGVALFLAYEMRAMGPAGKVLVGYVVSGALLGAGIFYERRERYRLLARVAIGGGWALTFFTTYAMYHVAPARVLHSQGLDLVLLLAVASAMVAHTLRYNSQVVTGLALLLGFVTVTISKSNVYSLSAGAILALALVIIVQRRRWYELEIGGILAGYFNHYYWLRPIIEPMGPHHHPFPEFAPSAALLIFYWLVFRASYLLRRIPAVGPNGVRPEDSSVRPNTVRPEGERRSPLQGVSHVHDPRREESISTIAALLNTGLLLFVMKYQSVHPEWAFRFLLLLGALEFALGQLPIARRRRAAFVVLSVLGATLLVAAIPFKYTGETLSILWLAEAEALFLAGVFLNEIIFCRLGLLATLLVAFQLDRFACRQIYDPEWKGFRAGELMRGAIQFAATTLIFYGDAHWLARRNARLRESRFDAAMLRLLSYVAGVTAVIGIWWLAPEPWVAVGLAGLALLMAVLGSRTNVTEFTYQAHAAAVLAFLRVLAVNFAEPNPHLVVRVATAAMTAVMLYACARWSGLARAATVKYVSSWHTWTATLLVGTLAWHELKPLSVALAWTLLGLALFEIGRARRLPQLRLQAYLAFASSFLRLFFVNFNAAAVPGQLSPRFYTTVPLALAFFYVYGVLDSSRDPALERDRGWKTAGMLCFLGTFTLAGWARFELDADWVVAAWAAMVWALLAIAWRFEKRIFLYQGLLLAAGVLGRTVLHNFYERSYFPAPFWQSRSLTVGTTVALLFAALPLAFQLRRPPEGDGVQRGAWVRAFNAIGRRPDQVFFFIPFFLLTILLALEVPKGLVTVAWGVEAVAVFLLALAVGQRSYRLSGLGLLLLCVGKIVVIDVWGLQPRDRYLTFIVLGVALLGVSFLYTRFRETIRQYL
jgi:hypothetical protein